MIKKSMTIRGHRTSISLEAPFWDYLQQVAQSRGLSVSALVAEIDDQRTQALMAGQNNKGETDMATGGLSSMIRVYLLQAALNTAQK